MLPRIYVLLPFEGGKNFSFDLVGKESRYGVNTYDITPRRCRVDFPMRYSGLQWSTGDNLSRLEISRDEPDCNDGLLIITPQDAH